jgi:hypothetical protein
MKASFITAASGVFLLAVFSNDSTAGAGAKGPDIKAFPGAEGWGAVTAGGRGGKVIKVTTPNRQMVPGRPHSRQSPGGHR